MFILNLKEYRLRFVDQKNWYVLDVDENTNRIVCTIRCSVGAADYDVQIHLKSENYNLLTSNKSEFDSWVDLCRSQRRRQELVCEQEIRFNVETKARYVTSEPESIQNIDLSFLENMFILMRK